MSFEIVSKYPNYKLVDGVEEVSHTTVQIVEYKPDYVAIQQRLEGDHTNVSDADLMDAVLDSFYRKFFADKAIKEQNQEIKERTEALQKDNAELREGLEKIKTDVQGVVTQVDQVRQMILASDLTKEELEDIKSQYEAWEVDKVYEKGDVVYYDGEAYEVVQDHRSQDDWKPSDTKSLYKVYEKVTTDEAEIIQDFIQPTGAHDSYNTGDKVQFEGKVYESTMDNNVYSPSDYPSGWKEEE